MLNRVAWVIERRILTAEFSNSVTLADFEAMNNLCNAIIEREGHPDGVAMVLDMSRVDAYDSDMISVSGLRDVLRRPPLVEWLIIVDPYPNPLVRFIGVTLCNVMRFRYHLVNDVPSVLKFLYTFPCFAPQGNVV
jgi:hypothetical protein